MLDGFLVGDLSDSMSEKMFWVVDVEIQFWERANVKKFKDD